MEADPSIPPQFSEDAMAADFAAAHADVLRHVAAWNRWLEWTGDRWAVEETLAAFDLARAVCRAAAADARRQDNGEKGARLARLLASAGTVAAVERLARADRRHAATVEQWDADPDTLSAPEAET
jgi:putative DNA primase/helicase